MKLYELAENYQEVATMMEQVEMGSEDWQIIQDTLEAIDGEFDIKVQNICALVKEYKYNVEMVKAEKKRLDEVAKGYENKATWLESYLQEQLQKTGNLKSTMLYGPHKLTYRKGVSTEVTDVNALPIEFLKTKIEADKTAIKKALQDGVEITGARLVDTTSFKVTIGKEDK